MRKMICVLLAGLLFSTSSLAAEDKPIDWRAVAIGDVEAAYKETAENHPGMLDKTNPGFPKLPEKARDEAMKLAMKTTSAGGYEAALSRFKGVIDDGHAGAYANVPDILSPPIRWPGFVAAWRGEAMYVYKSDEDGPTAGAQITSCDGVSIRKLIERNVFAYRTGRNVPGDWWANARRVFVDVGNPFIKLPQSCVFVEKGKKQTLALNWQAIPEHYQSWKDGSANGDLLPIGLSEKAPDLFWFAMPDFQPDEVGIAAYKQMYADAEASRDKLLKARGIVLDLRFNQGGSSRWSKNLAKILWGEDRVQRSSNYYLRNVEIWWRPTIGNEAAGRAYAANFKKQGNDEMVAYMTQLSDTLQKTRSEGKPFWIEDENPGQVPMAEPAADVAGDPPGLTTPVYVIVPGQCASACLDAIDYFKLFPNTKLIGAPSSADSTYMEVREGALPSGMGGAIIPMKIWMGRPRGNGVFYVPDILMTDFDWSTENFQKRIEADLQK